MKSARLAAKRAKFKMKNYRRHIGIPDGNYHRDSSKLIISASFVIFWSLLATFHFSLLTFHLRASAQGATESAEARVNIRASVGDFYLNLSGYITPYASVVVNDLNGTFLASTTADNKGYFRFSQILVNRGLSGFCFVGVDFRRLGESHSCLTIPPVSASVTKRDIFLPPTIGLPRRKIVVGERGTAYGYSMPLSHITLRLESGRDFTASTDNAGYYEISLRDLKQGKYTLLSQARRNGIDSLPPTKGVDLEAEAVFSQLPNLLQRIWEWLKNLFSSLGPLLFLLFLIPLIVYLLYKLWPERFTYISRIPTRFGAFVPRRQRRLLHHWWFVGF